MSEISKWKMEFSVQHLSRHLEWLPGVTLFLASWLPWQDLAQILLHPGAHGTLGKILTGVLPRFYVFQDNVLTVQSFDNVVTAQKWSCLLRRSGLSYQTWCVCFFLKLPNLYFAPSLIHEIRHQVILKLFQVFITSSALGHEFETRLCPSRQHTFLH